MVFVISGLIKKWNSIEAEQTEVTTSFRSTNRYDNQIRISGKPKRVILGYMLLSK